MPCVAMSCGTKGSDMLFSSCILCCMVQNRSMIPYFAVCKAMVAKFVGDISLSSCIYVLHKTFRWHHMFQLYARRFNIETFLWYHMLTICSSCTLCHAVQKCVDGTTCSSRTLCHMVQKRVGDKNKISYCYITFYVTCLCRLVT